MERKKVYVRVALEVDTEGKVYPRKIIWADGQVYEVDRISRVCPAASTKVGGCGMRYTVHICGSETFLFNEDGRWFVEAKESVRIPDGGEIL